jgi:hypothetical protein
VASAPPFEFSFDYSDNQNRPVLTLIKPLYVSKVGVSCATQPRGSDTTVLITSIPSIPHSEEYRHASVIVMHVPIWEPPIFKCLVPYSSQSHLHCHVHGTSENEIHTTTPRVDVARKAESPELPDTNLGVLLTLRINGYKTSSIRAALCFREMSYIPDSEAIGKGGQHHRP